ncbi:nucleosome-remodeling factor subunit BPTF-like [Rhopilema esculentum]|uniref:nucleosome-remodeling factor subunit BPTF-like n=1 Tax=Rhopilema esculentum TaxID=499914 RepID=UPI0031DB09B2
MPRMRGRGVQRDAPSRKWSHLKNGAKDSPGPSSPASSEASSRRTYRKSDRTIKHVSKGEEFFYEDALASDDSLDSLDTSFSSISNSDISSIHSCETPRKSYCKSAVAIEDPVSAPPLKIPPSSGDLLIASELLMEALQVYETVRHFSRILRISPFGFEDFCAALRADEQPCIIAEIHIALLRSLLPEDEGSGIVFGPNDEKDSINVHWYLLDSFTWPELVRSYILSDKDFADLYAIVEDASYPFVSVKGKLKVLTRLCDYFLSANAVREEIANERMFISDDYCRSCGRMGDLLCCELCPAVYHLACLKPPLSEVPAGDWLCPVCEAQKVKGVTDLLAEEDKHSIFRNAPLGTDRHRRKYWFLIRRIIIEGEYETFYYSYPSHLDELLDSLKEDGYEKPLVQTLEEKYDLIVQHMKCTEDLTIAAKGDLTPYLYKTRVKGETIESKDAIEHAKKVAEQEEEEKLMQIKKEEEVNKQAASGDALRGDNEEQDIRFVPDGEPVMIKKSDKYSYKVLNSEVGTDSADQKPQEWDQQSMKIEEGQLLPAENQSQESKPTCALPNRVEGHAVQDRQISVEIEKEFRDFLGSQSQTPVDAKAPADVTSKDSRKQDSQDSGAVDLEQSKAESMGQSEKGPCTGANDMLDVQRKGAEKDENAHAVLNENLKTDVKSSDSVTVKESGSSLDVAEDGATPSKISEDAIVKKKTEEVKSYFKLGMEGSYVMYENQYYSNSLASSKNDHQAERDKRRVLGNKFRLYDFKWLGEVYQGTSLVVNTLRSTMLSFESSIPTAFLHPMWYKQLPAWIKAVRMCKEVPEFAAMLTVLQRAIKPLIVLNVWRESLGHLMLKRMQAEGKNKKSMRGIRDRDAIDEDLEDDENGIIKPKAAPVKFSWIPRHKVWEQKGEEYRLDGGGGWAWSGGVGCLRSRKRRRDNAWPTAEEKSSKIRKLEVVVGTVKDRKEKARKINSTQDIKEKVNKVEGEKDTAAKTNDANVTSETSNSKTATSNSVPVTSSQLSSTSQSSSTNISKDKAPASHVNSLSVAKLTSNDQDDEVIDVVSVTNAEKSTDKGAVAGTTNETIAPQTCSATGDQNAPAKSSEVVKSQTATGNNEKDKSSEVSFKKDSSQEVNRSKKIDAPSEGADSTEKASGNQNTDINAKSSCISVVNTKEPTWTKDTSAEAFSGQEASLLKNDLIECRKESSPNKEPVTAMQVSNIKEETSSKQVDPVNDQASDVDTVQSLIVSSDKDVHMGSAETREKDANLAAGKTDKAVENIVDLGKERMLVKTGVAACANEADLVGKEQSSKDDAPCNSTVPASNLKNNQKTEDFAKNLNSAGQNIVTTTSPAKDGQADQMEVEEGGSPAKEAPKTESVGMKVEEGGSAVKEASKTESVGMEVEEGDSTVKEAQKTGSGGTQVEEGDSIAKEAQKTRSGGTEIEEGGSLANKTQKTESGVMEVEEVGSLAKEAPKIESDVLKVSAISPSKVKTEGDVLPNESVSEAEEARSYPQKQLPSSEGENVPEDLLNEKNEDKAKGGVEFSKDAGSLVANAKQVEKSETAKDNLTLNSPSKRGSDDSSVAGGLDKNVEGVMKTIASDSLHTEENDNQGNSTPRTQTKTVGDIIAKLTENDFGARMSTTATETCSTNASQTVDACGSEYEPSKALVDETQRILDKLLTKVDVHSLYLPDPPKSVLKTEASSTQSSSLDTRSKLPLDSGEGVSGNAPLGMSTSLAQTVTVASANCDLPIPSISTDQKPQPRPGHIPAPLTQTSTAGSAVKLAVLNSKSDLPKPVILQSQVPAVQQLPVLTPVASSAAKPVLAHIQPRPPVKTLNLVSVTPKSTGPRPVAIAPAPTTAQSSIPVGLAASQISNAAVLKALATGNAFQSGGIQIIQASPGQFIIRSNVVSSANQQTNPRAVLLGNTAIMLSKFGAGGQLVVDGSQGTPRSSHVLTTGTKLTPQPTPVATYLTQLASNAVKAGNRTAQETLNAKAAALQSLALHKSDSKTSKALSDSKKPGNAVLYENAEKNMCTIHKIVDEPVKLIKHELRAWKQRKRDIKGIFLLDKHKLKKLARQAGMKEVDGFQYNTKQTNGTFAQFGFPRPNFENSWKFRVLNANSFASVGHLLRILHCCLRWDVINIRPPRGVNHSITTSKGIITIDILDGKPQTPDGLVYSYLVKKIMQPFKVQANPPKPKAVGNSKDEKPATPIAKMTKGGIRLRERTAPLKYTVDDDLNLTDDDDDDVPFPTTRQVIEEWLPEESLDLWEIRQYWDKVEMERNLRRERQQAEEDARKNIEAKRAALLRRQTEQMIKQQQQQQQQLRKAAKVSRGVVQTETPKVIKQDSKLTIRPVLPGAQVMVSRSIASTPTRFTAQPTYVTIPGKPGVLIQKDLSQNHNVLLQSYHQQFSTTQPSPIQKVYKTSAPLQVPMSVAKPLPLASPSVKSGASTSKFINRSGQAITVTRPQQEKKGKRKQTLIAARNEAVCKSVLNTLLTKLEKLEEKDKQKQDSTPSSRRRSVSTSNRKVSVSSERLRKLRRVLKDRKDRLKNQILKKRQLLERNLLIELGDELYNQEQPKTGKRKRDNEVQEGQSKKIKSADEKLYCLCKTPYDEKKFYVGCDLCNNWFHGDCVGISEAQAESMDEFICDDCKRQQHGVEQEELYCLCKQPYDESKFYIGCDMCQDWFHGTCVGITQAEADFIENYVCPRCSAVTSEERVENKRLSPKDIEGLKRLLRSLQSHKMAWPFLEPVDESEVVDYYNIVKEPMDLQTMDEKIRSSKYKTLKEFVADASRIFDNCRYYNTSDSPFYRCAEVLENFFVQKLKAFKNTLQKVSK